MAEELSAGAKMAPGDLKAKGGALGSALKEARKRREVKSFFPGWSILSGFDCKGGLFYAAVAKAPDFFSSLDFFSSW